MRILYTGLCVLALLAVVRLSLQIRTALADRKDESNAVLNRLGTESDPAEFRNPQEFRTEPAKMQDESPAKLASLHPNHPIAGNSGAPDPANEGPSHALKTTDSSPAAAARGIHPVPTDEGICHRAALHESMLTPGNFQYLGAFRPPHVQQNGSTFAWGGWALAFRPDGEPSGPDDGFPGSLFIVGHLRDQKVAEITIPAPVISRLKRADDLPVAEVLQPFDDVSDGIMDEMTAGSSEPFRIGGMIVTNRLLHWTTFKYYNVENIDYPSHGISGLDTRESIAGGLWHLGPQGTGLPEWHSYKHAGYILEIPEESRMWFHGAQLISGLQISTGLQASSQGPAMFAYSLPQPETASNTSIPAIPLVWYSQQAPLEFHHPADRWSGAAWLTLGKKQAVIVAGRKALGAFYYGEARPEDCTSDKGYHGPPYEVEMLFYSPASLIHAANGKLPASGLKPWLRWDGEFEGGGLNRYMFDTCAKSVGGLAYDREHNLLYLVQIDAGTTRDNEFDALPIVHVFRIAE